LVAVAGLIAAACGGGGGASEEDITIAIGSEPTTLDPQIADDGGERAINDNVYETLMARDQTGALVPGLAAEEPTQLDETTWQFKLQDGITFHNGEAFNADSVVASVERLVAFGDESAQAGFFATITGAEKVDDLTVNILTNGPDPVLPSRMYWMKMVPADASQQANFADNPVGTGPYTFVEWVKGDHITLARNDDYWDGAPNIAGVTYKFVSESGTRLSGLLAGEYDLITNLLPEDVDRAPKSAHVQGLEHPVIVLNARGGVTADVRVRQALNYAVDKEALADQLFAGFGVVDDGQLLSPSWFGYNADIDPYPFDPDMARSLLEEANATGASIEIVGTAGRWLKDRETVEAVAAFWSDVGLDVKVSIFEFDEYLNRLFDQEGTRSDAIYVTHSNELLDADRTLSTYYQDGGVGASNSDTDLAQLIEQARTETDVDAREDAYNEAVQIAYDQAYFVWLLNIEDIYGMSERLDWQPRVDAKLLVKEMSIA
jgi:peptide/nickel transport system substrate-binding protein